MSPIPYPQWALAKGYVPIPAIAAALGVAPSTVYRWADEGRVEELTPAPSRRMVLFTDVVKHVGLDTINAAGYGAAMLAQGISQDLLEDCGIEFQAPPPVPATG